jgi:hypothetical protein
MSNPFFEDGNKPSIKDSSDTVELTVKMFFGEDGHAGYQFTHKSFLVFGESLRVKEAKDLKILFQSTKDGLLMTGSLSIHTDRAGRPYVHPEFILPKARVGVKIILEEGMDEFISDYQNGYIRNNFTLDELIEEARKTN